MKIKILLAPSMIVASIVIMVWYVYPAYTDPLTGNGVKEKSAELTKSETQLKDASAKNETVKNLAKTLASGQMSSVRDTVMKFMPQNIKEYEVIDNLNYIVLKEELSGTSISVSQPTSSGSSSDASLAAAAPDPNLGAGLVQPTSIKPEATVFEVEFSAQGSYVKIKNIFRKVYGLKRFNRVVTMEIAPAKSGEGESNPDNLKATAVLEFAYFKESGKFDTMEDSVFSKSTFDTKVADLINTKKDTSLLPDLQVDQKGKTNPFTP